MAETSGISWTRSTFNPWIGCTKVGPGCDSCYAEALDKRMRYGGAEHWGDDKPRYRTSVHNWNNPMRWNKAAEIERRTGVIAKGNWHTPGFWPVFCASLADVFDNQVEHSWRRDLWKVINDTPNLEWLLVTKRIGNAAKMLPGLTNGSYWPNVRILITVVNQDEADRDIPKLLALPCKNGISYEPALGPVDWSQWLGEKDEIEEQRGSGGLQSLGPDDFKDRKRRSVEWLIIGGESRQRGGQARPFQIEWARSTIAQCKAAGVPAFVKQLGSAAYVQHQLANYVMDLKDRAGADPDEWPSDLRLQEFPR